MASLLENLIPCTPPWWAKTGHLQTIFGHIIPSERLTHFGERIELEVSHGDRIAIRYYPGNSNKVIYLFHGLGGSADADYIQRAAQIFTQQGHTVILLNHRGCGEGQALAVHPYHSGSALDLSAVLQYGRKREPSKFHIAIGVSLSGNALLLLASGTRGGTLPDAAITVNAPIQLAKAAQLLHQRWNRIYDLRFILMLKKSLKTRGILKHYAIPHTATLMEFDDIYTAPAAGFKNKEDYYQQCSAAPLIPLIKIPTIVLTSQDDPFISHQDYTQVNYPASVTFHLERFGGHVGYLDHSKKRFRWLDYFLEHAVRSL